MAAKTVGELGCGLALPATSSQRCSGGVELDRSDRRRLQRGDAGEHVVGLAPSTQAHQAAGGNPEVERAEARVEPCSLRHGGAVERRAQRLLGVTDVEEDHRQHGVGERPAMGRNGVVDRGAAVIEAELELAGQRLHDAEHARGS